MNIQQSFDILTEAYQTYNIGAVIALTSFGNDSQVSTHLANEWRKKHLPITTPFRVYTINTGLSADGYVDWCWNAARELGYNYAIWHPEPHNGLNWYKQNALEYGFGYTRYMHSMYYRMLKERTVNRMRRYWHNATGKQILFVSGIYRAESSARANADIMSRTGNTAWVSPIVHWTKEDITTYRYKYDLPQNPFYETTGGSGDCQCNWGQFVTFDELQSASPKLAAELEPIHHECINKHGWGYGEQPSGGLLAERAGQMTLPGIEPLTGVNLCEGCQRVKPRQSDAEDFRMLQGDDWLGEEAA